MVRDKVIEDGVVNEGTVRTLLDSFIDYLENDEGLVDVNIKMRTDRGNLARGPLFMAFSNWVSANIDDDWWDIVYDADSGVMRDIVEKYYNDDEEFRESIQRNTEVVDPNGGTIGSYDSVELGGDDDGESGYGKLEEIGIVDGEAIDMPKLKGAMLSFARSVDEITGPSEELDRTVLRNEFNRWMLNKFGSSWSRAQSGFLGPEELSDSVVSLYKLNDEFKELVQDKYNYDESKDYSNKATRERITGTKREMISEYDDEEVNPFAADDVEIEEDGGKGIGVEITGEDIIHGDSTEVVGDIIESDVRIGAIITDPPYAQDYDSRGDQHDVIEGDSDIHYALGITEEVLKKTRMTLRDGSPIVVFAGKTNLPGVISMMKEWYSFEDINVWEKGWVGTSQMGGTPVKWRPNHEYAVLGLYGDARVENENRHDGNVWSFKRMNGDEMEHPTQKPIELMKYIIESLTEEGDVVFDPFAGSGSTLVAANQLDRGYIGVEYDEEYHELAKGRLNQDTLSAWVTQ